MATKTKLEFVSDMIAENPNSTRLGIINKLIRHRHEYRGKKFDRITASRYYWEVTRSSFSSEKNGSDGNGFTNNNVSQYVVVSFKVPRNNSIKFKKYVKAVLESGLMN